MYIIILIYIDMVIVMYKKIIQEINYKIAQNNYKKIVKRIKNKNKKIIVVFYVTENQKWAYQSLYEEFEKNTNFTPLIVIGVPNHIHIENKKIQSILDENYNFFKKKEMHVEYGYKNGEFINLKFFNPDIVFYEQPWEIPKIHRPNHVSKYALTCFCPYSISTNALVIKNNSKFFEYIWKYFIASEILKDEYKNEYKRNIDSLIVTGHPKLDSHFEKTENSDKKYVIYAPHHAITGSLLNYSTFEWSGKFMLDYAKSHQEFNWVFKPHPNIKFYFKEIGYMTDEEIENYYEEWAKIGIVHEEGNYFGLFNNSECMITDCGSFLVEYFFTNKPLIHLISSNSSIHSSLNKICSNYYYKVHNIDVLESYLNEILVKKNDFLKNTRTKKIKDIFPTESKNASKIINYLNLELEHKWR